MTTTQTTETTVRVAAHIHSEWSYDASWSLARIGQAFGRLGVDVVLMSEHNQGFDAAKWADYVSACHDASTAKTLLVPGIEYADTDNAVHIPIWGELPFLGDEPDIRRMLEAAAEMSGFSVFAHPGRKDAWSRFDPQWAPLLSAVEVWNRKYDGWAPDAATATRAAALDLQPFVSLDFHTRRQFFPLALALTVVGPVNPTSVYAALNAGAFEPLLAGLPAMAFTRGMPLVGLRGLERARRGAARAAHVVAERRTSGRSGH